MFRKFLERLAERVLRKRLASMEEEISDLNMIADDLRIEVLTLADALVAIRDEAKPNPSRLSRKIQRLVDEALQEIESEPTNG